MPFETIAAMKTKADIPIVTVSARRFSFNSALTHVLADAKLKRVLIQYNKSNRTVRLREADDRNPNAHRISFAIGGAQSEVATGTFLKDVGFVGTMRITARWLKATRDLEFVLPD